MKHLAIGLGIGLSLCQTALAEVASKRYEALTFDDKDCEILLPQDPGEPGVVCGRKIARKDVLRNTSFESKRCEGWGGYCAVVIFRHSVVYKADGDAAQALAFYFVNKNASDRFTEEFVAWLENAQPRPMQWEKGI